MGRKSSITQLDPRIRDAVNDAVRDGRATIDEILVLIKSMGGEVSRSAVGRHVKKATEQMKRYRDAQEVAKVWIAKLTDEPEGDVGRLVAEMVKTVAFQQLADMGESDKKSGPMDLMLLAKAMDHVSRSQKVDADRQLKIRKEVLDQAAKKTEEVAKAKGLSADTVDLIKRQILGIGA